MVEPHKHGRSYELKSNGLLSVLRRYERSLLLHEQTQWEEQDLRAATHAVAVTVLRPRTTERTSFSWGRIASPPFPRYFPRFLLEVSRGRSFCTQCIVGNHVPDFQRARVCRSGSWQRIGQACRCFDLQLQECSRRCFPPSQGASPP